jgi:hypothetical protein
MKWREKFAASKFYDIIISSWVGRFMAWLKRNSASPLDGDVLRRLYLEEKLSAKQIADRLGIPEHKVVYWLTRHKIPKRSLSEAAYLRINLGVDPFDIKTDLNLDEEKLKAVGLILWVTEGSLKNTETVYATNSNPELVKLFVEFLLRVCRLQKHKIRIRVIYYPNMEMSVEQVRRFWSDTIKIPHSQIKIDLYTAAHNYRSASKYGTATALVGNIKLRKQMEQWLYELYGKLI